MNAPTVIETVTLHMLGEQQKVWSNICNGWRFDWEVDEDPYDRTKKKMHYAVGPDGRHYDVHWSAYSHPDYEDQAMLIAVGFGSGPRGSWDKEALREAIQQRMAA